MLNFKFIHQHTNTVLCLNADSTEFAQKELEDLVLNPKEWYIDDLDDERYLPDSTEAPLAWVNDSEVLWGDTINPADYDNIEGTLDTHSGDILPSEDDAMLVD